MRGCPAELVKNGGRWKGWLNKIVPEKRKGGLKRDLTGEWMSSSRSTEQRSHCSNVSARCMIFLTIFSRSVCSSNRSFTTSSRALRNNSNRSKCIQITQAFRQIIKYFKPWDQRIVNKLRKSSNTLSETARSLEADFESVWKTVLFSNISAGLDSPCSSHTPCGIRRRVWRWRSIFHRMVDTFEAPVERNVMLSKL